MNTATGTATANLVDRAAALGYEHGRADARPFGTFDDIWYGDGSAALMDALGETGPTTAENEPVRQEAVGAYTGAHYAKTLGLEPLLVNAADWDGPAPEELPDAVIVNAPRPLSGVITWHGRFRHGIFYAAAPSLLNGPNPSEYFGWARDDAHRIVFITNDEIAKRVYAKLAEYGYHSPDEIDATVAEIAIGTLNLPWHEDK